MHQRAAPSRAIAAIPVAEYVRMSTDHQQYSTTNQSAAIADYAGTHGMTVVRSYRDEGRSGLDVDGRRSLQQLIADVRQPGAGFEAVLVYDVSRWGRFQNTDEAAYYEYLCTLGGIRVIYVAETFADDRSPLSAILKGLKRAMAAEYSRELSVKVFTGQCRLIRLGYRQGGIPGYGFRRMLIDASGRHKGLLGRGERKSLATDRVILVPGPAAEVAVVRAIFRRFIAGEPAFDIAAALNAKGVPYLDGRLWQAGCVRRLLADAKYIGHNLFARRCHKLRQGAIRNAPESWVRQEGAFPALVPLAHFQQAQALRDRRRRVASDAELMAAVRRLYARCGYLSAPLINREPGMLESRSYIRRFGSLRQLYQLAGYTPPRDLGYVDRRTARRAWHASIVSFVSERLREQGSTVEVHGDLLVVDDAWTLGLRVLPASLHEGTWRWFTHRHTAAADIVIFARMPTDGSAPMDYIILPRMAFPAWPLAFSLRNNATIEAYTFPSLAPVMDLARWSA